MTQSTTVASGAGPGVAATASGAARAAPAAKKTLDIIQVLATCVQKGGSDVVLTVDSKPRIRLGGRLRTYGEDVLSGDQTKRILYGLLTDEQKAQFEEHLEIDFAVAIKNVGRFRVNGFRQRGAVGAAFRPIPARVPSVDDLDLPKVIHDFATYPRGLVLVTGVTGSGKSTLLAALINKINCDTECHIITIEDPIEFVHPHKKALIEQREVGQDTRSFGAALKHILRQNPDVILLGEMRDPETIQAAITLAETGHLVFSTLHTQTASQTMDRMIDSFPAGQQNQVRAQLSLTLRAVVSQTLLPTRDGVSRVAAREVMLVTTAISSLVREGKTHMIHAAIETNRGLGMVTMEHSIKELIEEGRVDPAVGAIFLRGIQGQIALGIEGRKEESQLKTPERRKATGEDGEEDAPAPEPTPASIEDEAPDPRAMEEIAVVTVTATMPDQTLEQLGVVLGLAGAGYQQFVARATDPKLLTYALGLAGISMVLGLLRYGWAAWRRHRAFGS